MQQMRSMMRYLGITGLAISLVIGIPFAVWVGGTLAGMESNQEAPLSPEELRALTTKYIVKVLLFPVLPFMLASIAALFVGWRKPGEGGTGQIIAKK